MTETSLTVVGRRDARGHFGLMERPAVGRRRDVRGHFTAVTGPGALSGGDVWGRLAVSTAGAWSLYSLATPTVAGEGRRSC